MVDDKTLALVERGLGFKLYPWQRDFLQGRRPNMAVVMPRHCGRTTLMMLHLALSDGPPFILPYEGPGAYARQNGKSIMPLPVDYPVMDSVRRHEYAKWFVRSYLDVCYNLEAAGLHPRWIEGYRERMIKK